MKKIVQYLIILLLIIAIIHFYSMIYLKYLNVAPQPGTGSMVQFTQFSFKHFVSLLLNVIIGMLFGLEMLYINIKKVGKWHFNVRRFLIIGIPALFLSVEYFNFFLLNDVLNIGNFSLIAPAREPFFRFLAGYSIITSFYKVQTE